MAGDIIPEDQFLDSFGFAYSDFLRTTNVRLLSERIDEELGQWMLDHLEACGVGPAGLAGVDIKSEMHAFDRLLWTRYGGGLELRSPSELRLALGLTEDAPASQALTALVAAAIERAKPARWYQRLASPKPLDERPAYTFSVFWLQSALLAEDGEG